MSLSFYTPAIEVSVRVSSRIIFLAVCSTVMKPCSIEYNQMEMYTLSEIYIFLANYVEMTTVESRPFSEKNMVYHVHR